MPLARAASSDDAVVAVLPFTWTDKAHAIYSKAVAHALAQRLGAGGGVKVLSISLSEQVPEGVSLVVSGKILARDGGKVAIEVSVRDPEIARIVGTASTRTAATGELDQLVAEVAPRLGGIVARELVAQRKRRARRDEPIRLSPTVVRGDAPPPTPVATNGDTRPRLVVLRATGRIAGGAVPVEEAARTAEYRLAERMGYRPVAAVHSNVYSHREAGLLAQAGGARAALKVHVRKMSFDWVSATGGGFLTARGLVRVVLTGADGAVLFDETVRTDTIVGSPGDRHVGVVRMVLDQALDIAAPYLGRALARTRRAR